MDIAAETHRVRFELSVLHKLYVSVQQELYRFESAASEAWLVNHREE